MQNEYADFVESRLKDGPSIYAQLTPEKCELVHIALGIMDEASELANALKATTVYNKPLDVDNIVEEIGDVLFWITAMVSWMHKYERYPTRLEYYMAHNEKKLKARYAVRYSDAEAVERKDKA